MVRPSKPCSLASKIKHHRISQEKKPKVVNNVFCWCSSMSFCSSISYTILQTHLNTSMFTISPGQPTWRWTARSESSESSENLEERRRGSSKICPKIDGTNVVKSLPAHSFGPILVRLFCRVKGQKLDKKLHAKRSTFEWWLKVTCNLKQSQLQNFTTPNLLRNRCGGRQATQWSKGQKCRLHGFQRYFGCGNHRGLFICDTCTRSMNINESNWINRHKKFVVRSFRFKNHILFRFLWQITQTRGVAREMSWPAARGLRRRVRVTFEIPEKPTSPSSWRKRHLMFFHVFFMTNEKQKNDKQTKNKAWI